MKLEICKLDSNRNLSGKEISWFVSAIHSFSQTVDLNDVSDYKGRINNLSDAFSFYALPPFKDGLEYTRNYDFQESDLFEENQMSKGNSNPAALACCCRKDGLLDDYDNTFQLTPVAKNLLLTKKIHYDEFVFLLLTKQWVRMDDNFVVPMLSLLWECINKKGSKFLEDLNSADGNNQSWSQTLFKKVANRDFDKTKDTIVFTRQDILKNSLLYAGLLTLKNGMLYVPDSAIKIWETLYKNKDSITIPEGKTDTDYYRFVGSLDTGLKNILEKDASSKYAFLNRYPNLVAYYCTDKKDSIATENNTVTPKTFLPRVQFNEQIVFYGVPGCGKSKTVKDKLSSVDEFTRVVFHADFSNADFIGQILPETVNGNVQYKYKPSAFIKMLKDAYKNPEKKYALIIEELNRGNAPAIFGSLFQLLDRKASSQQTETINGNTYDVGWSDYSVSLENVNAYFRTEDGFDSPDESTVLGGITITAKEGIRFPKNLSIYATMNTSDQNVFTLDNAFQRRWSMQMVSNELNDESQKNLLIGNTGVTWGKFRNAMNARIIAASNFSSLEDRRLGGWFILKDSFVFVFENGSQESKDAISKQAFANKVIKYLWDDAFKFDRSIFVNSEGKTLEDVINDFNNDEIGMKIFDAEFNQAINA